MPADAITPLALVVLVPLALAAFALETVIGFGAVALVASVGALIIAPSALVPALVALEAVLCGVLAIRHRQQIDRAFLARLLLAVGLGLPVGIVLIAIADVVLLRRMIGGAIVVAASVELWRARVEPRALGGIPKMVALAIAGVAHFATGVGGLITVYAAARALLAEGRLRATMFAFWVAIDAMLFLGYRPASRLDGATLALIAILAPSCALGLVLGERAHRRLSPASRRVLVYGTLAVAGAALVVWG
ncbi:MAG: TSUP family transporter [Myxococcota bacterium]|nr:TSUP family transporter [Myxococcota bacterium]